MLKGNNMMNKIRAALLGALCAGFMVSAVHPAGVLQQYTPVNSAPYQWNPLGYSQFSVTGAAIANLVGGAVAGTPTQISGLTAIPANASCATIIVETASIRWRDDGTAPTASIGIPWTFNGTNTNTPLVYCGTLANFQIIALSGTPVVNVYFTQ